MYEDIRDIDESAEPVDLICGGFPCQDISVAGKQAGIHAAKSGLFFDLMRVVRMVAPRYVLLENVPTLLSRSDWMGAVLGELAESGFDAEWDCIPAQAVGAPHRRDRVFVVADADRAGLEEQRRPESAQAQRPTAQRGGRRVAEPGLGRGSHGLPGWIHPTRSPAFDHGWEDGLPRVATGIPNRIDRLRGLGNAVVPQVATYIAHRILDIEDDRVSQG